MLIYYEIFFLITAKKLRKVYIFSNIYIVAGEKEINTEVIMTDDLIFMTEIQKGRFENFGDLMKNSF